MQKNYKFNGDDGSYEFCDGKDCELQDALKDGDSAHVACKDCIEEYEGKPCDQSELKSTVKLRKLRKQEIPHAEEFISGVGTNRAALEADHNAIRGNVGVRRPDLDSIESGDV